MPLDACLALLALLAAIGLGWACTRRLACDDPLPWPLVNTFGEHAVRAAPLADVFAAPAPGGPALSAPGPGPLSRPASTRSNVWLLVLPLLVGDRLLVRWLGPQEALTVALGLVALLPAAVGWQRSRMRAAARPVVARDLLFLLYVPAFFLVSDSAFPLRPLPVWIPAVALTVGVLALSVAARATFQTGATWVLATLFGLLMAVGPLAVVGGPMSGVPTPSDVSAWCAGFGAADAREPGAWEHFGRVGRWLRDEGLALDPSAALALPESPARTAALNDAGLGEPRPGPVPGAPRWSRLLGDPPTAFHARALLDDPADLETALRVGAVSRADAERVAAALAGVVLAGDRPPWPLTLHSAATLARLLHALGAEGPLEDVVPRLHALLAACWVSDPESPRDPGGFRLWPDLPRASSEAVWPALDLMRHVGVPGTVSLERLHGSVEHWASRECGWLPRGEPLRRTAALHTWARLEHDFPLHLDFDRWIVRAAPPLLLGLFVLNFAWLLARAPKVRLVRPGAMRDPLAAPGGRRRAYDDRRW